MVLNAQDYRVRSLVHRLVKKIKELEERQVYDIEARAELLLHLSKISHLEGQVEALLQTVYDHARKIEMIEDKQRRLDGLRANLS